MTTKAAHTPGPWRTYSYSDSASARQWTVGTPGGDRIADNIERGKPTDEAEANARLIAAAPELLEACKSALRYYEMFRDSSPMGDTELDDIAWIKAAILAATGGGE